MIQQNTHRLSSTHAAAGLIVATAMPLLLLVAEISGLAAGTLRSAILLLFAMAILFIVFAGRTSQEALFFGRRTLLRSTRGGALVGAFTFALLLPLLTHSMIHLFVAAIMVGVGVLAGSLVIKTKVRADARLHSPIIGALFALCGCSIVLIGYQEAIREWALLTAQSSSFVKGCLSLSAVLVLALGGWRATLGFLGVLTVVAIASAALAVFFGASSIGPPPLPMFSDQSTLEPINALRLGFNLNGLPFPDPTYNTSSAFSWLTSLLLFGLAGLCASVFLHPTIEDEPTKFAVSAALSFAVLGCLAIAIGGYALEAAAREFFNNPISQPALGLLDATRQGLVMVCGEKPVSEDALLAACKTSALSKTLLTPDKVALDRAFLALGLPHALGFGVIASLLANLWKPALSLILVMAGLLVMMTGIGNHIFCLRYQKPGLASFRIALMRIAAALSVMLIVAVTPWISLNPDDATPRWLALALMLVIALAAYVLIVRAADRAPESQEFGAPHAEAAVEAAKRPKLRKQGSPKGKPSQQG